MLFLTNPESRALQNICVQQLISQTIQVRQTRHEGHCWKSKGELSDLLLWTPTHEHTSVGQLAKTYIH